MELKRFYTNARLFLDESSDAGKKLRSLLDEVILRLPQEEQFDIKGQIGFNTRENAIRLWQGLRSIPLFRGNTADFTRLNRDGNCTFAIGEGVDNSGYIVTIIIDHLHARSDNYVKGLIAHELSELSYMFRLVQKEMPTLRKMGRRARKLRLDEINDGRMPVESPKYEEHENNVNKEAIRLGFSEEIKALELWE